MIRCILLLLFITTPTRCWLTPTSRATTPSTRLYAKAPKDLLGQAARLREQARLLEDRLLEEKISKATDDEDVASLKKRQQKNSLQRQLEDLEKQDGAQEQVERVKEELKALEPSEKKELVESNNSTSSAEIEIDDFEKQILSMYEDTRESIGNLTTEDQATIDELSNLLTEFRFVVSDASEINDSEYGELLEMLESAKQGNVTKDEMEAMRIMKNAFGGFSWMANAFESLDIVTVDEVKSEMKQSLQRTSNYTKEEGFPSDRATHKRIAHGLHHPW